ncbi:hypothetical protein, partial [Comamonas endophytica]|uniref:hypothetical protein n=1 Tax=Comamonas endophytica TaxID=2949090 RepID=UPI001E3BCE0C
MHLVPKELGNRLQTPTLIGCMFLRISGKISFLAWLAVISEALNYATVLKTLSTLSFSPQIQSRD